MCIQCAAGAMVAGTAVVGTRQVLLARARHWLTPRRTRVVTAVLLGCGVLAAGLVGG